MGKGVSKGLWKTFTIDITISILTSPILLLTATAPKQTREALIANLSLKDPRIIIVNLNRKNIHILVPFHTIIHRERVILKQQLVNYPLTIIYTPMKWCGYMHVNYS